jgi:hypothetical protein
MGHPGRKKIALRIAERLKPKDFHLPNDFKGNQ